MSRTRRGRHSVTKAAPKPLSQAEKAQSIGASDVDVFGGTLADANSQRMPNEQQYYLIYEKHPWVRACVRLISHAVAQEGFAIARVEGGDFKPVAEGDDSRILELREFFALHAFNGKTFRAMMFGLTCDIEVHGKGYWRRRAQGSLLWYERMDPRLVVPKLNSDRTAIECYKIKRLVTDPQSSDADSIPVDEVIYFAQEGGDSVLGAPSPLEALDYTVATDLNIRQHRNKFFQNGTVGGRTYVNKGGHEDQVRAAVKMLRESKAGSTNAFKTEVLTGDWEIHSILESGKQDFDFLKATELTRDEICAVYSVPVGKLTFSGGSLGSAGKGEDDETFEQDCVLPIEELIYEKLTREIIVAEFGITDLALVPKRRSKVRADMFKSAELGVKFGMTGNEVRALVNAPAIAYDPATDPPERERIADMMNVPLFLTVRGQNVEQDSAESPDPNQSDNGNVEAANNAGDKEIPNEVAAKAKSRFRHYAL